MMSVAVLTTPTFSPGNPTKLFDGPWFVATSTRSYDVSPDGQRFLMLRDATIGDRRSASPPITVVLHWTEELKARVPGK